MKQRTVRFTEIKALTSRLVIRPYHVKDYAVWKQGFLSRRPKNHKYDEPPVPPKTVTRAVFSAKLKRYKEMALKDKVYVFGVFLRSTGENIGWLDLATIQRGSTSWANLGYCVHNSHQRRGYAKEFVKAGLQIGFKTLGYKRIEAAINLDNKPSIALAEAVGMKFECVRPQFYFENGRWTDHLVYVQISKSEKLWCPQILR